jgi:hypothetical protein
VKHGRRPVGGVSSGWTVVRFSHIDAFRPDTDISIGGRSMYPFLFDLSAVELFQFSAAVVAAFSFVAMTFLIRPFGA